MWHRQRLTLCIRVSNILLTAVITCAFAE
jgi:hypothetical protein